ncbi:MAG: alpha/beta fold hydrolase [Planctomycetota bacterium]|nr:alpha/beta fold hydrolase [Planctomycetota bacterium]
MPQPIGTFPRSLAHHSRWTRLAGVPSVIIHPALREGIAWPDHPAPTLLWLHGRTVSKELDPGRYQRAFHAGYAVCAIDLPGHGERRDLTLQGPESLADLIDWCVPEIDAVVNALVSRGVTTEESIAIGGMSAGGMIAIARLCEPHSFKAVLLESTTGDFLSLHHVQEESTQRRRLAGVNPIDRLSSWQETKVLALHSEADAVVPVSGQRRFIDALRSHARHPDHIRLHSWKSTGAPNEHAGFGNKHGEAKELGTEFIRSALLS